jgi:hypothetical protein
MILDDHVRGFKMIKIQNTPDGCDTLRTLETCLWKRWNFHPLFFLPKIK